MGARCTAGGQPAELVEKFASELEAFRGSRGDERRHAANAIRHAPVGSSGPPLPPGWGRSRASGRTLEEPLETLNAMSEAELVKAYGGIRCTHRREAIGRTIAAGVLVAYCADCGAQL